MIKFAAIIKKELKESADALHSINGSIERLDKTREPFNLSKSARYLIWWLTQIETDVYDSEFQGITQKKNYIDKICTRNKQKPTEICLCILESYDDLRADFRSLFDITNIEAKKSQVFQTYLDQVGKKIIILKQDIAIQVKDIDTNENCIPAQDNPSTILPKQGAKS